MSDGTSSFMDTLKSLAAKAKAGAGEVSSAAGRGYDAAAGYAGDARLALNKLPQAQRQALMSGLLGAGAGGVAGGVGSALAGSEHTARNTILGALLGGGAGAGLSASGAIDKLHQSRESTKDLEANRAPVAQLLKDKAPYDAALLGVSGIAAAIKRKNPQVLASLLGLNMVNAGTNVAAGAYANVSPLSGIKDMGDRLVQGARDSKQGLTDIYNTFDPHTPTAGERISQKGNQVLESGKAALQGVPAQAAALGDRGLDWLTGPQY